MQGIEQSDHDEIAWPNHLRGPHKEVVHQPGKTEAEKLGREKASGTMSDVEGVKKEDLQQHAAKWAYVLVIFEGYEDLNTREDPIQSVSHNTSPAQQ